jgi:hypothetical protein
VPEPLIVPVDAVQVTDWLGLLVPWTTAVQAAVWFAAMVLGAQVGVTEVTVDGAAFTVMTAESENPGRWR